MDCVVKLLFKLTLGLFLVIVTCAASFADPLILTPGADYAAGDFKTIKNTDLANCQAQCAADSKCKAFTFNTKVNWCFLKSKTDIVMPFGTAVGGTTVSEQATPAKALQPELKFIDPS